MNVKKLAQSMAFAVATGVGAAQAGIPVADGLQLAQTIAMSMAEQMMHEALAEARDKLSEKLAEKGMDLDKELADRAEEFAWEMYEETFQKDGYGWDYGYDGDWNSVYTYYENVYNGVANEHKGDTSLSESMERYEVTAAVRKENMMESEVGHLQEAMDKDLQNKLMQEAALAEINKRKELIDKLRSSVSGSDSPRRQQEVQNAIAAEQAALMNEQLRLQTLNSLAQLERETELHRVSTKAKENMNEFDFSHKK